MYIYLHSDVASQLAALSDQVLCFFPCVTYVLLGFWCFGNLIFQYQGIKETRQMFVNVMNVVLNTFLIGTKSV